MDKQQRLPPEYKKAIEVISHVLEQDFRSEFNYSKVPKEIVTEGTIVCISKDFKSRDIPSDFNWKWNQVKARKVVCIQTNNGKYEVEFFKLMARPCQEISYKLWRFNVKLVGNEKYRFRVLWCEQGVKSDILSSVALDDLQFLSQFMDPRIANEIWPQAGSCNCGYCML